MKRTQSQRLVLLFSLTYMASYLTRINYGAVISEMEAATGFTKQALSMALIGSFITYGAGQVCSGMLGDRISPKRLVMLGLGLSSVLNALLPLCPTPAWMAVVWSVNGLAQACMWPPIVRLMAALLTADEYNRGVVRVSWGSSIGTIVMYLAAPLIITLVGWKGVFYFGVLCGVTMLALWQRLCPSIEPPKKETLKAHSDGHARVFTPLFFVLAIAIAICGMLRDGVATWTPSLIAENFHLSNASGILSGAVLPVFGMACYEAATFLYRKCFRNPLVCAGLIFLIGVVSSLLLRVFLGQSPVLAVLSVALLNGSMHGANLIFTGMLPAFYQHTGRISTVSGVLNSFVYIGSALSTYGIAALTETLGWNATVMLWLALAALGAGVCFAIARKWWHEVRS